MGAFIEFGEWMPDLPDYMNPGATVCKNVVPAGNSYQPFLAPVVYSSALPARCQGAFSTRDTAGNTSTFAGDATKLYKLASAAYSDVSIAAGYTTAVDERWFFTQYGNNVIATNINDAMQVYNLGTSSLFANLSATAPKARYVCRVRDFLVVGNTNDATDGSVPYRVRWPNVEDITDWTVSASTQADYQDLDSADGWVKQVVGGEYGVIFQERAITRMSYIGSPAVFQFAKVESNRGTQAPGSVVKIGNQIAYLGIDGFYIFDGNQSVPIGTNKIDKTFYDDLDANYMERICSVVDFSKQIIYWAYPNADATAGRPNRILCYNYSPNATKRWSRIETVDIEFLFTSYSEGYTLDGLDAISSSIDALAFSLDSRVWTGNNLLLSAFDSSHKQTNFTGTALDAVLETAEAQVNPKGRANITNTRPIIDGSGTVTVQMGARNLHSESASFGSAVSVNTSGYCPVRSNARYHRARVNVTGGFNDAQGIDLIASATAGAR